MACANCMASARVTPLRGSPERDPERDPERGFACLCFSLRGTRACKQAWDPVRAEHRCRTKALVRTKAVHSGQLWMQRAGAYFEAFASLAWCGKGLLLTM